MASLRIVGAKIKLSLRMEAKLAALGANLILAEEVKPVMDGAKVVQGEEVKLPVPGVKDPRMIDRVILEEAPILQAKDLRVVLTVERK